MKLVIGLGNPGREYVNTRHNVGWLVLDSLAGKEKWQENKKGGFFYLDNQEMLLVKPATFMNNSGKIFTTLKKKYPKIKLTDIIVIHDDKDLDFGRMKVARDSSSAGHKGVQSIIEALGSQKFTRLRVGVKNELLEKMPTDKFVLGKFSKEEKGELGVVIEEVAKRISDLVNK